MNVFTTTFFGIEVEFTGIPREEAARAIAQAARGEARGCQVTMSDGRVWKVVYDSSITAQRKGADGRKISANESFKCELVSPILSYQNDIDLAQAIIRKLRKTGAFTSACSKTKYCTKTNNMS
jgi:hypothetical protein